MRISQIMGTEWIQRTFEVGEAMYKGQAAMVECLGDSCVGLLEMVLSVARMGGGNSCTPSSIRCLSNLELAVSPKRLSHTYFCLGHKLKKIVLGSQHINKASIFFLI